MTNSHISSAVPVPGEAIVDGISTVVWNTPVPSPVSSKLVGLPVNAAVFISSDPSALESHSIKPKLYVSAVPLSRSKSGSVKVMTIV